MKIGVRKVNLKNRFRARTTAKWKRQIKSSINPFYGRKGFGWIRDPRRALYNKIYHKTTISAEDALKLFRSFIGAYRTSILNLKNKIDDYNIKKALRLGHKEIKCRYNCNAKILKIFLLQVFCFVLTVCGFIPASLVMVLLTFGYIKPVIRYYKDRK